jgi:predicted nucleic acid-binding protein
VSLVLDSSATLAWIYSDETTNSIRRLFDAVGEEGAVVPTLWRLEIANSLTVAVRRGRIEANFRRAALTDLALLDIATDDHTDVHAWGETLRLADISASRCMTLPIWSLPNGATFRSPRWTVSCMPRQSLSALA